VRGKQKRKSDLDILVDFEEAPTLFGFIRLERFLSKELNIKIDLVMKSVLKPNIGRYILNDAVHV
jgi:predicted nucleotidyltransferase